MVEPSNKDWMLYKFGRIQCMLNGYIAYLKRSKRGATEPGAQMREQETPYYDVADVPELD
jgi:hypothetical protein